MTKTSASYQNRRWLWIGVVLGIIAILVVGAVLLLNRDDEKDTETQPTQLASEVSVEEAAALRDQGAFVLDVRQPEEWAEVHIPGATLIPLGELSARLSEVPQDQQIVVICRSGNRSAQGRDVLVAAGYEQVTSMAGGMTEWQSQGYPTESGE